MPSAHSSIPLLVLGERERPCQQVDRRATVDPFHRANARRAEPAACLPPQRGGRLATRCAERCRVLEVIADGFVPLRTTLVEHRATASCSSARDCSGTPA